MVNDDFEASSSDGDTSATSTASSSDSSSSSTASSSRSSSAHSARSGGASKSASEKADGAVVDEEGATTVGEGAAPAPDAATPSRSSSDVSPQKTPATPDHPDSPRPADDTAAGSQPAATTTAAADNEARGTTDDAAAGTPRGGDATVSSWASTSVDASPSKQVSGVADAPSRRGAASPPAATGAAASPSASPRSGASPSAGAETPQRPQRLRPPPVPMQETLATKARRLPRIYGRPPSITHGAHAAAAINGGSEPKRGRLALSRPGRSKASTPQPGGAAEPQPERQRRASASTPGPSDGVLAASPPPQQQQQRKRLQDMTEEELAVMLRARLEERRAVPRLSRRRPPPPPPVKVDRISNITTTSADVVVGNRELHSSDGEPTSVRLMISLDEGRSYITQAVAPADVFRVNGLQPGQRYRVYAVLAAGKQPGKKTVVHFTTHNAPGAPRMGPVPGQDLPAGPSQQHSQASLLQHPPKERPTSLPPIRGAAASPENGLSPYGSERPLHV